MPEKIHSSNKLNCSCLPQRWVTVALGFLGCFVVFAVRTCLSITITEMVVPTNITRVVDVTCPGGPNVSHYKNETRSIGDKFMWSEHIQGLVLSSSYWGNFVTTLIGGTIADKFGGKHTLSLGVLICSVSSILTPFSIQWGGAIALIAVRVLMGLGEGLTSPALSTIVAKWIPQPERSWAASWVFTGGDVGTLFGMGLSGAMIQYSGSWPIVHYYFGTFGIFGFFLICAFCYSKPSDSPFISTAEQQYLKKNLKHTTAHVQDIPWRYILRSKPVWALVIANAGQSYGYYVIMSDMPKYMSSVLKYPVDVNGYISSIAPLFTFLVSNISSYVADRIIEKKIMSTINVRRIAATVTLTIPGIFLILSSYAGCNATLAVVLHTIGWSFSGFYNCSITSNMLDLAPNYAGTLSGFISAIGIITGFVAPCVVGALTPNQNIYEWRLVFWLVFVVFFISNVLYLVLAGTDVEEWNDPDFLNKNSSVKEDLLGCKSIPKFVEKETLENFCDSEKL